MSGIADTKAAIAAAVTGVAGLTGYATKPAALKAGDAFVRWRGWSRAEGTFEAAYAVIVVLPSASEDAADAFVYEHADALEAALRPVLYVDGFEPSLLPTESGDVYALTITGRTE